MEPKKIQNWRPSIIDTSEQWYLGGEKCIETDELVPDGQWMKWFPAGERQNKNGLETNNCTNYSLLNCIEAIGRKKYGIEFQSNLSERERGIRSSTQPNGNTLQNVCECLRKQGTIPEAFLAFDNTIDSWGEYYSPNPIPFSLWKVSESWRTKYKYAHDWAILPSDTLEERQRKMKEALKYSPLTVAGHAWTRRGDGLYYSDGEVNHAFDIAGYMDGKYWIAIDSYPDEKGSFEKRLAWNYHFREAKRHSLEKNVSGVLENKSNRTGYVKYLISWYLWDLLR